MHRLNIKRMKGLLMDRSILITGCSSGIGYDAAHGLKARGWRVFATCRNEVDCENLRKEGLESFRLIMMILPRFSLLLNILLIITMVFWVLCLTMELLHAQAL